MDWGSLISTVVSTVGTVVGALLGANKIEDGVVAYLHRAGTADASEFTSAFCKDGEKYLLFNQSSNASDIIAVSFPARGNIGAESVMIPGRYSFDMTNIFHDNALHDSTQFELTAAVASQNAVNDEQSCVRISSSGKDLPVDGQSHAIGAYLEAQVSQQEVSIYPRSGVVLQRLPLVSVQGSGDSGARIMDATGEQQKITCQLPQPLDGDDVVNIEVLAEVQTQKSLAAILQNQKHAHLLKAVDEDMANRVAKAPRLNWKNRA